MLRAARISLTVGFLTALPACDRSETDVVDEYLTATRDRDLATLARTSVVGFPSEVSSWHVHEVTAREKEPFRLKELQDGLDQARQSRDAQLGDEPGEIQSLRHEVEQEREAARKSLETWSPIDDFDGEVDVAVVLVTVESDEGEGLYYLTLKRYNLIHREDGSEPSARWIVTAVQEYGSGE
jgi:hypothetical protein